MTFNPDAPPTSDPGQMELCAWDGHDSTKTRIRVTIRNGDQVGVVELEMKFVIQQVLHAGFKPDDGLPALVVQHNTLIRIVSCDSTVRRKKAAPTRGYG